MRVRRRAKPRQYRSGNPNRLRARHQPLSSEIARLSEELEALGITGTAGLTAAGDLIRQGQATYLRRLIMPWQIRAFGYYDLLGEIKYSAQFYSRSLSNLELFAARKDENGELIRLDQIDDDDTEDSEGEEDESVVRMEGDQVAIDALERVKDPGGGGRTGLLSDYGRLMFLVGESLLFVWRSKDESEPSKFGPEKWEMLSTDELRTLEGSYTRFMAPTLPAHIFRPVDDDKNLFTPVDDKEAVAYRLHRRHPRFSALADSTLEGALDICEELVLLTQVVRARVRSRLAGAGVLFLDDRITTQPNEATPDEDPLEDPFIADLTEAAMAPITDEGTASAVVPMIARVRVPENMKLSDLVYHLQIVDPLQIYPETGLRMECIRRLAIVLDMPAEVLLGVGDVTHWNAWMIDEQSWKAHLQPVAQGLVEDLTSAYFQPYLKEQGVENWFDYYVAYDASKVINHPDRTADALKFNKEGLIGDRAAREAGGWDEDDAPTEDELARRIGVAVRDSSLAWDKIPSVRSGGLEPEPGELESPDGGTESETPQPAEPSRNPGPPQTKEDAQNGGPPPSVQASATAYQVAGAAQLALLRARDAAGARLRTTARRDNELTDLIQGHANRDVAAVLGRSRVRSLLGGASEDSLVYGARDLILDCFRVFGVEDENVCAAVADTVERHAVRTLYDTKPPALPVSFTEFVSGLLTAAEQRKNGH